MAKQETHKPSPTAPLAVEHRLDTARREVVDLLMKHKVTLPEFFYLIEIIKFDSLHAIRQKTDQERAVNQANRPISGDDRMYR